MAIPKRKKPKVGPVRRRKIKRNLNVNEDVGRFPDKTLDENVAPPTRKKRKIGPAVTRRIKRKPRRRTGA